ncbi:Uma2 family endonuclease [Persicitalea sp.]|uniref:Uma2 family endonuclease n=1 Tax=Persicitalea sp. TaxID=3100273 RepID=UPI003593A03D
MISTDHLKAPILEQLKQQELVRVPASEEEFFALSAQLPFKIEYHESEIVTMGLASYWHEVLIMTLGGIFYNLFSGRKEFTVSGSNTGVKIPKFEGGYYLPDVVVMKGEPEFKPGSTAIILNPYIVVEVLSPATSDFDISDKLPDYKRIDSLQQVIFVSQKNMTVSSYTRSEQPGVWLNQDFFEDDELMVENMPVSIKDIYDKVQFAK